MAEQKMTLGGLLSSCLLVSATVGDIIASRHLYGSTTAPAKNTFLIQATLPEDTDNELFIFSDFDNTPLEKGRSNLMVATDTTSVRNLATGDGATGTSSSSFDIIKGTASTDNTDSVIENTTKANDISSLRLSSAASIIEIDNGNPTKGTTNTDYFAIATTKNDYITKGTTNTDYFAIATTKNDYITKGTTKNNYLTEGTTKSPDTMISDDDGKSVSVDDTSEDVYDDVSVDETGYKEDEAVILNAVISNDEDDYTSSLLSLASSQGDAGGTSISQSRSVDVGEGTPLVLPDEKPPGTFNDNESSAPSMLQPLGGAVVLANGVDSTANGSRKFVTFGTEEIMKCLLQNGSLSSTEEEIVFVFQVSSLQAAQMPSMSTCTIKVQVPVGMVVQVRDMMQDTTFCSNLKVRIVDTGGSPGHELVSWTCTMYLVPDVFSLSSSLTIHLSSNMASGSEAMFLRFRYTSLLVASRPQLEAIFTSLSSGYIQTPGFGRDTVDFRTNMDSWLELPVPPDHSAMISFSGNTISEFTSRCNLKRLDIHLDGNTSGHLANRICETESFLPAVYHTSSLVFHFLSTTKLTSFRVQFSLHPRATLPQKLPNGRWNCSAVPDWTPFHQHFPCNVNSECLGGEDEAVCPYTSNDCGVGSLAMADGCFLYVRDKTKSWDQANRYCLSLGLKLAVVNTPQRVAAIRDLFEVQLSKRLYLYVGLRAGTALPYMYRGAYYWSDRSIAHNADSSMLTSSAPCGKWYPRASNNFTMSSCEKIPQPLDILSHQFLCEKELAHSKRSIFQEQVPAIVSPSAYSWRALPARFTQCPAHHITHTFLTCDPVSACWGQGHGSATCDSPVTPLPPSFECASGGEHVPYTLVCDHRADCKDSSDEAFCQFAPCTFSSPFDCGNGQCLPWNQQCDGLEQCLNGVDERCTRCTQTTDNQNLNLPPESAVIRLNAKGQLTLQAVASAKGGDEHVTCEETHFRCPQSDVTYCLPVFLRCNGLYDCPGHGDEAACDSYTCPGFYRCRNSRVCVHPTHLCDGLYQCPQHDDELLCDLTCPDPCVCHGLAFFCSRPFNATNFPSLRFLEARGSGMTPTDLENNTLLIHLSLASCHLTALSQFSLLNLRSLDLSDNLLTGLVVQDFERLGNLQEITLASNPLSSFFQGDISRLIPLSSVISLDVSKVILDDMDTNRFHHLFPGLQVLNMSGAGVRRILGEGFTRFTKLQTLDMRGCPLTVFPHKMFEGLQDLASIDADNYKVCCPVTLPLGFNVLNCRAPTDDLSSCDALLRSDIYRTFLSAAAGLSLVGNIASTVYRLFFHRRTVILGFDVFVTNLALSDTLMGVYLAIVGVADRLYLGSYLWKDEEWKTSAACKFAGFLSMVSREVSAILICLITLDRFLVLHFPFRRVHFRKRSAIAACTISWLVGILIAAVPLLPATSHWQFYSQTGICIPLPITRSDFPGRGYSFGVIIVLNLVLFLLIALGQVFIFWSVRANSMSACDTSKKSKDLTVARRLISVAASNFLCWFPIGLLGVMASHGEAVSDEVNVAMAIFVLPINSALNPFLYTVNLLLERRRRVQEERMMQRVKREMLTSGRKLESSFNRIQDSFSAKYCPT